MSIKGSGCPYPGGMCDCEDRCEMATAVRQQVPTDQGVVVGGVIPEPSFVVTLHACPERGHTAYWFELQETIRVLGMLYKIEKLPTGADPPSPESVSEEYEAIPCPGIVGGFSHDTCDLCQGEEKLYRKNRFGRKSI